MQGETFAGRMDALWRKLAEYELDEAVADAAALRAELRAEVEPDREQAGWAFYSLFKALHAAGRSAEAHALLISDEDGRDHEITPVNRAWMYSVGAECAILRDDPAELVRLGQKCLALRMALADLDSALQCASSMCALLMARDLFNYNGPFARFLVQHAGEAGRWDLLGEGISQLHWHARQTQDARALAEATAAVDRLAAVMVEDPDEQAAIDAVVAEQRAALGSPQREVDDEPAAATPLWDAASEGDVNRVAALLDAGAEIDAKHTGAGGIPTPLIAAAFCGHIEVVRLLLARGADVEAVNSQGRSALVQAADQGHAEIVELLAHAGSAVDRPGLFGQTALHLAAWQGHRAVVQTLLACAARTDLRDDAGMTPLALACTEDVPEVVELLLAAGAPVEDRSGSTDATPLIMAAIDGQARVAGVLLDELAAGGFTRVSFGMQSAVPHVLATLDRTHDPLRVPRAVEWARAEGHESVAQLLEV